MKIDVERPSLFVTGDKMMSSPHATARIGSFFSERIAKYKDPQRHKNGMPKEKSTQPKKTRIPGQQIFLDEYIMGDMLGQGAFGYVRAVTRKSDGAKLAVKAILKDRIRNWVEDVDYGYVPREVHSLRRLSGHANILQFVALYETSEFVLLVTERPHGCIDLFEYVEKSTAMTEAEACKIFKQVANAVAYCHTMGVAHRDVKDENCLINPDTLELKLIDFGSSTNFAPGAHVDFKGTMEWAAPEQVSDKAHCAEAAEVWTLGMLLYVIIFAENPFEDMDPELRAKPLKDFPFKVTDELTHLLRWMLSHDAAHRPTVQQVLDHPWMNYDD